MTERRQQRVEALRQFWEAHGGEWGAKSQAVKLLFGPHAPAAGVYWDRTMEVIELLEWEKGGDEEGHDAGMGDVAR